MIPAQFSRLKKGCPFFLKPELHNTLTSNSPIFLFILYVYMYAENNGYVSWQLEKLLFSQAKGFCFLGGFFGYSWLPMHWKLLKIFYSNKNKHFIKTSQSTLTIHATSLPPPPPSLPKKEKKSKNFAKSLLLFMCQLSGKRDNLLAIFETSSH